MKRDKDTRMALIKGLAAIIYFCSASLSLPAGKESCRKRILLPIVLLAAVLLPCSPALASYRYGNHTYPGGSSGGNNTDGSRSTYMAMTSPDIRNMRVTSFRIDYIYSYAQDPRYIRMGLYEGGIPNNPAGALLKYDTGPVLIANTTTYDHAIPLTPPYDLGPNTQFGIALKTDVNFRGVGLFSCMGWPCPTDASGGDCDFFWNNQDEPQDALFHFDPQQPFHAALPGTNLLAGHRVNAYNNVYTTFYYWMTYVLYPSIDSIAPAFLNDGQTDVLVQGAGFENKNEFGTGTSKLWLTENNDWAAPGTKVQQTDTAWTNTAISFTATFGALAPGTTAYLWVENSDGQVNADGYPVVLNVPCPMPPAEVPGALSVTPDDGTLVSGAITITDEFTDTETVYGCLYSTDDGAVWRPGVISGTGPYTCTAGPVTSTEGALLSIRMKATSCGGTSTPSSLLSRTVDALGPAATSFTATPADTKCTLDWSAHDSGTGLHVTVPFEVRWDSALPVANCSSGTLLYSGTDMHREHTGLENGRSYSYRLCMRDKFGNLGETSVVCTLNATPWTVLGDGTSPANGYVGASAVNRTVSTFTLALTNGTVDASDTVTGIVVTGTNTANISASKIYRDDGSTANRYDAGDTLIASSAFSGDTAAFSGLSIPVTSATTQYLVTYDTVAAPAAGETLTAYISSAAAQTYSVDNNDNADATLTLETTAPTTTDNINSSAWQGSEVNVYLSASDSGSGVDAATGIYGCFGTGCIPAVLGGNTMTTSCGAGNACEYAIRYYSVDRAGNTEPVKTDAYLARVDRKPPSGGTFTAFGGGNPIALRWTGITDTGSGITYYSLRRRSGSLPPATCSSDTSVYGGLATSYDDTVVSGQQYSYRLCVSDAAGNVTSDYVATATAGEQCLTVATCTACHGSSPNGGSRVLPPSGHTMHGSQCVRCHREGGGIGAAHVDGKVTLAPDSGWNAAPDIFWPSGITGGSCGGTMTPVGGPGNPMGCHSSGTATNPGLNPQWRCNWDGSRWCSPP